MAQNQAKALTEQIGQEFRRRLCGEYVPRIDHCVNLLSTEQVWHKPSRFGNSVGNLLQHLAGNTRQWILAGIRGDEDHRQRDLEFAEAEDKTPAKDTLIGNLRSTVEQAADVVAKLSADDLLRRATFQGRYEESNLAAVLHVMEHFSGHAGQIYAYTKQALDIDLQFYDL